MARTINRLNPLKVKALDAPGLHADGNGLYLSVGKTGAKSWALVYRWRNKRVELGLGPARAVTLAQARDRAQDAASLRAQNIDPRLHWRRVEQGTPTFGKVALDLIESREEGWKNAKHRQQWRNTLKTYAAPIWERAIDEVAVDDLLAILSPIWMSKPETANRVRGRIEAVLDAAKVRGLRTGENPAAWRGNLALLMPKRRKGPKKQHDAMLYSLAQKVRFSTGPPPDGSKGNRVLLPNSKESLKLLNVLGSHDLTSGCMNASRSATLYLTAPPTR